MPLDRADGSQWVTVHKSHRDISHILQVLHKECWDEIATLFSSRSYFWGVDPCTITTQDGSFACAHEQLTVKTRPWAVPLVPLMRLPTPRESEGSLKPGVSQPTPSRRKPLQHREAPSPAPGAASMHTSSVATEWGRFPPIWRWLPASSNRPDISVSTCQISTMYGPTWMTINCDHHGFRGVSNAPLHHLLQRHLPKEAEDLQRQRKDLWDQHSDQQDQDQDPDHHQQKPYPREQHEAPVDSHQHQDLH